MKTSADVLLTFLLDAYERRTDPTTRAISVGADKLPGYTDEYDPAIRQAINAACQHWETQGWLTVRWVRGEKGNLLERVTLRPEAAPAIYTYLERLPLREQQAQLAALWQTYRPALSSAAQAVLDELTVSLMAGHNIQPFVLADPVRNTALLRVWAALDTLDGEIAERDFSARVLGDSKSFTPLKAATLQLLRRSHSELATLPEVEAWAALGVLANPGHLYLHGPLIIAHNEQIVDLQAFIPDLGLPVAALATWELCDCKANAILTIENRTTYYNALATMLAQNLIIYLGGFPNSARCAGLQRLSHFSPHIPCYHWGDLDYGGFAILAHLRRTVNPAIRPHQMDVVTLRQFASGGKPLSASDRRNLTRLLTEPLLADCYTVIRMLLELDMKIEQELLTPLPIRSDEQESIS